MTRLVTVTTAPVFDPEGQSADARLAQGLTIAQIVAEVMPWMAAADWGELRVALVTPEGLMFIEQDLWRVVRPNAGVHVVIRARPGGTLISALVVAASKSVGAWLAAMLVPTAGALQTALAGIIAAGLTVIGTLLIKALIPQPEADDSGAETTFTINGWRNQVRRGAPVPTVYGLHRMAPPFAAGSYTEIVDDEQYVRALFCFGYGPVEISDLRIGETPIEEFDEVQYELREGYDDDLPVSIYSRQVIEDVENVELTRPFERDNLGEPVTSSPAEETPVIRYSAYQATGASAIFAFPSGLFRLDDGDTRTLTVSIRIRMRPEDSETWTEVTTLDIAARNKGSFFRQHRWELPGRGRWVFEFTRMTDEFISSNKSGRVYLSAVQSFRPEYPLNIDKPLALLAVRIRATHQLTGTLDEVNALVQRIMPKWDGSAWGEGASRNPAAAYLSALMSPSAVDPQAEATMDMDEVADWYEYCDAKGLKYDRIHDGDEVLGDRLALICAAGRATPHHDGQKYGVVVDRPSDLVVDEITDRNSSSFSWERANFTPPHGFRVPFRDETNGYELAERIVPWPGYTGAITKTETLELPGKTDPDEIWVEARRRMYELLHRPDTFMLSQDQLAGVTMRGDQVAGMFSDIDRAGIVARVKEVRDRLVVLDEPVTMEAGTSYAMRFRSHEDEEDNLGSSTLVELHTDPGRRRAVRLKADAVAPDPGRQVMIGEATVVSSVFKVKGTEGGDEGNRVLMLVAAAPEIDTLADAETPPEWNGIVGAEIDLPEFDLAIPRITLVEFDIYNSFASANLGLPDLLLVHFATVAALLPPALVRLHYREVGAPTWTEIDVPPADGLVSVDGLELGDEVEFYLTALSTDLDESDPGPTITYTVGEEFPPAPGALDESSITVTGGLGHAQIDIATATDTDAALVAMYRVPVGETFDADTHLLARPLVVEAGGTISFTDGDGTRSNILADDGFDDAAAWTADAGWIVSGSSAEHSAGSVGGVGQAITIADGDVMRGWVDVEDRTAGSVTPQLLGGTTQSASAITANARIPFEITAATGNTSLTFTAGSPFDGALTGAQAYIETGACSPQDYYDYYFIPINEAGLAGPMTSAFRATII